ncbi:hypothetical protein KR084_001352 [Drosophila pseudotakahashii]|nr:hypothetical protein KR084_001352 [Drosophila pseudotakahashii]
MERIPSTPSPASTYCSVYVGSQHSPVRRSQRLIDMEIRNSQMIPPKSCSPQLFGSTEDCYTELLLQQEKPTSKVVHLKPADKVVHLKSSDEIVRLEPSNKVVHLKPLNKIVHQKSSDKIIHLKKAEENQDPDSPKTSQRKRTRPATPSKTSQRKRSRPASAKKRGRKPKQPAEEKPKKLPPTGPQDYPGISPSSSKLPSQYPAHFVHQLPPAEELIFDRVRSSSDVLDFGEEDTHIPDLAVPNTSPSETETDFSMNISLSDSIGEIFGTKDVSSILKVQPPRKYFLLEDHLPALATMLNVNLERLRGALEITLGLTHEQIMRLPVKQEVEEIEYPPN